MVITSACVSVSNCCNDIRCQVVSENQSIVAHVGRMGDTGFKTLVDACHAELQKNQLAIGDWQL